jgi:hypothetical protein
MLCGMGQERDARPNTAHIIEDRVLSGTADEQGVYIGEPGGADVIAEYVGLDDLLIVDLEALREGVALLISDWVARVSGLEQ